MSQPQEDADGSGSAAAAVAERPLVQVLIHQENQEE